MKTHLDLFSGIGGFALAARWAGFETIGFCEIDKYAQKVLKKNFPGVPIYDDVTKLKGSQFKDIYLLTGGFPCQDISIAGKGAGIEGERSGLWSELHRIISEVRPKYALVENVPALTFRGGTRVIGDLTEIGYDCEWQIVGADDVGAPHRRKRIWIVAYANGNSKSNVPINEDQRCRKLGEEGDVAYPKHSADRTNGGKKREEESVQGINRQEGCSGLSGGTGSDTRDVAHSKSKRVEGCRTSGEQESHTHGQAGLSLCQSERSRAANWLPEPSVGRVVNGLPNRVDRLKGLGNAIVPQVAYEIMRCLK